jgi:hypothetical protein
MFEFEVRIVSHDVQFEVRIVSQDVQFEVRIVSQDIQFLMCYRKCVFVLWNSFCGNEKN